MHPKQAIVPGPSSVHSTIVHHVEAPFEAFNKARKARTGRKGAPLEPRGRLSQAGPITKVPGETCNPVPSETCNPVPGETCRTATKETSCLYGKDPGSLSPLASRFPFPRTIRSHAHDGIRL
jgi:hypothetical protein